MNDRNLTTDVLDLTDLSMFYHFDENVFPAFLEQIGCRRLYIGSYFCEKYFIKTCRIFLQIAGPWMKSAKMRLTLVVPIPSGNILEPVKNTLFETLHDYPDLIDEVIVNDYGMLNSLVAFNEEYSVRIIAGRLFFRNYRDARYGWDQKIAGKLMFPGGLAGKVCAADLDLVSEEMDLSEIPDDVEIHIHYPYVYTSLTHICEFASVRMGDEKKFRTMLPCGNACMNAWFQTVAEQTEYLHFGKAVYTKGLQMAEYSRKPDRFIYWPAGEFMKTETCEVCDADLNTY